MVQKHIHSKKKHSLFESINMKKENGMPKYVKLMYVPKIPRNRWSMELAKIVPIMREVRMTAWLVDLINAKIEKRYSSMVLVNAVHIIKGSKTMTAECVDLTNVQIDKN